MTCPHAMLAAGNGGTCPVCIPKTITVSAAVGEHLADRIEKPRKPTSTPFLDPAVARMRLSQLRAVNARERFSEFVKHGWSVLHPGSRLAWNWHLDAICDHAQAMIEDLIAVRRDEHAVQRCKNLVINIPPRQLKTELLQIFLPAWGWLHDPSLSWRCLSGNSKVVNLASQDCRTLIGSAWYREWFKPTWDIEQDTDAVKLFKNTARGRRHASTTLEKITGEGTDVLIVDDPQDAGDANSEALRERVNEKWDKAIESRVNDRMRCVRIGIMQRLHEEDWSGHVLKQPGWDHLCLPMEYEAKDVKGRCKCPSCVFGETFLGWVDPRTTPGELLHATRMPKSELEAARAVLGPYGYAGQMQQRPAPADGGMFKRAWFKDFDPDALPRFDDVIISCDLANSEKAIRKNSNNALLVLGRKGSWRYVLDEEVGRWSMTEIEKRIEALQAKWQKLAKISTVKVLVEKKAAGNFVISALKNEMGVMGVVEDDEAQKAHNDKMVRASAVVPQIEGGNVMIPVGAPWKEDFLHEICVFPNGSKDDRVDALTQALNYWRGSVDLARAMMMAKW